MRPRKFLVLALLVVSSLLLTQCGGAATPAPAAPAATEAPAAEAAAADCRPCRGGCY